MRLFSSVVLAAASLALAGCLPGSSGPSTQIDNATKLPVLGDVGKGHRVVFVLNDVSCDMGSPQDKANREKALLVGAHAAALDRGVLEAGVVRAIAAQNVNWRFADFNLLDQSANTARFRIQDALLQRDMIVKSLRTFVNRATGNVNNCASDLVSALSAVELKRGELGSSSRIDLIYVTNGLIVDQRTKIVLTKNSIVTAKGYQQTLRAMLHDYPLPNLRGVHVWLVGTGWSPGIKNDQTGAYVRKLWRVYVGRTGAKVRIYQNTTDLVSGLLAYGSR
jgi:hypothetical protein